MTPRAKILRDRCRLVSWCIGRARARDAVHVLAHILISLLTRTSWTRRRSLLVDRLLEQIERMKA